MWSYKHGKSHLDAVRSVAFDPTVPLYDTDEFMMPQHLYLASVGGQSGTAPTAYTNLISAPEDVTGYGWGVQGDLTRQANTHQAPDGSFTADSITSPASAGATTDNLVVEWGALTPAVGAQYTYAGHVRKDFADNVQFIMYLIDATPDPSEIRQQVAYRINLTDGSTISLASNHNEGGPAYTEDDVSITLVEGHGDYWRVTITLTDYEGICERWRIRIYPYAQVEAHPARTLVVWGQQATAGGEAPPYGGDPGSEPTITKLQIVGEEQVIGESASARATRYLGIAGGDVVTMKQGAAAASVTGGSGALDAVAPHIATAVFRNKVYLTDGRTYKVYDAKDNKVEDFTSEDAGEIPKRGRLMVAWDNRLVIARTADSDHNWYMSKKGEPTKWDVFPPIWTVLDAVSGDSDRGPGQSPDIINALIPWSDDLLLMGGDHTIQRMTGNPLAGGQIDLVSDQTGISFGSPWAKDPEGVLYFFGSRGGVYAYAPGQQVQRITLNSIDRELQDVNLGTYRVGMAWSYREDGLYVFQLPFGTGGVEAKGWFFERKTGAWWDVEFSSTTLQPTALTVFDGDSPSDRIVAFGCEDGLVRYFDENAKDDDGTRIDSRVLIGPLAASQGLRSRFSSLQVTLASDQDGATAEWFASDAPDVLGEARIRRDLMPGLSPTVHRKVSGGYLWLKLHNGAVGERWAFEAARATVAPAGRTRVLR